MSQPDDKDLLDLFAAMRRAERATAPAFANVAASDTRQRGRRASFTPGLAVAAVAATIIVVLVIRDIAQRGASDALDLRAMQWTAPTDFLLNVTGHRLLRDVPTFAPIPTIQFDTTSSRRISS